MRNLTKIILSILLIFIIMGCTGESGYNYIFPLQVGNRWSYQYEVRYSNFEPDSLAEQFEDYTYNEFQEVVGKEVLSDTLETHVIKYSNDLNDSETERYYRNENNGLKQYSNPSIAQRFMNSDNKFKLMFRGRSYENIGELFSYLNGISSNHQEVHKFRNLIRIELQYPLNNDSQWFSIDEYYLKNLRKVVGFEEIEVPAGIFKCFKIEELVDLMNDGDWEEDTLKILYFSAQGWIRGTTTYKHIQLYDEDSFDEISGYLDVTIDWKLTSYSLQ